MSHVGVKRLAPGDAEEDAAEHQHPVSSAMGQEADCVTRIEGGEDAGIANDPGEPKDRDNKKPEQHDRAEGGANSSRAEPLGCEEDNQDGDGRRHDEGLERTRHDIDTFERAEHRDGRRDDAVAIEQGRAEQAHDGQDFGGPFESVGADQRHQGKDSAFPMVVGAHDEQTIFDRNGDDQGPDEQRQDA
ncbi:hypothetical protein D9M73_136260 [compost metagenome]